MAAKTSNFPTDWHRDRYIEDLGRELAGAKKRVEELATMGVTSDDRVMKDAHAHVKGVEAELAKVKPATRSKKS